MEKIRFTLWREASGEFYTGLHIFIHIIVYYNNLLILIDRTGDGFFQGFFGLHRIGMALFSTVQKQRIQLLQVFSRNAHY